MNHKATYSPEDNKLRLYPSGRLPREEYDKLKLAGFSWAPKQELFVAPMWTPEREDLLLEFAGEIEDEDTSLVERAEQRAERFEEYSEARMEDAEAARKAVGAIADNIPLGQPILVGHHSEKRARKDAERIESGMHKAVKMWETSKYWTQRAAGAIHAAKYKELPSVRARRIKKLEAESRKRERAKEEAERLVKFWEGKLYAKNPTTGEKRPIEIKNENREWICNLLGNMPNCGVRLSGNDGQNWYSAWDILRPDEERYKNCPVKTVEELRDMAIRLQSGIIARCDRWIAHFNNRLDYEKAMLEADGGTEADKNKPEKGGACRCWASPKGGWSYIQKVNKVSVTVLDNWGNGGSNFTRVIPFDKLSEVMSATEVRERRDAGLLIESGDGRGFMLRKENPVELPTLPEKDASEISKEAEFKALKHATEAGVQVVTANQLFPTPLNLAKRLIELADIQPGNRVLEPSAGTGNLLRAMPNHCESVAVEIDPKLSSRLHAFDEAYPHLVSVLVCKDFLECTGEFLGMFDRVVMNPPFENGADIKHIKHAMGFLKPGGKLVAICAAGPRQREQLEHLGEWIGLPEGSFSSQGTNVRTAILIIEN